MLIPLPPLSIVAPVGNVQLYEVAFDTAAILYLTNVSLPNNGHTLVGPVIVPGMPGGVVQPAVTVSKVVWVVVPQIFVTL